MAELLARKYFDDTFYFDSAGLYAKSGADISLHAAQVLATHFACNAEHFTAKNIKDLHLDDFDCIVALDSGIVAEIAKRKSPQTMLLSIPVQDPYGENMKTYAECAQAIQREVVKYLAQKWQVL